MNIIATNAQRKMTNLDKTMLIIGLERELRKALTDLCLSHDYATQWVESEEEAVAILRQQNVRAAICGSSQSHRDPPEVLRTLSKVNPRLPIILLAAGESLGKYNSPYLFREGALAVIDKPYTHDEILAALAQATCAQPFVWPLNVEGSTKDRAEGYIRYFDLVYARHHKYRWKSGAETAREWVRLMSSDVVSEAEMAVLVDTVARRRWWGTIWCDLADKVSAWACSLGFPGVDFYRIPEELPEEPEETASSPPRALL